MHEVGHTLGLRHNFRASTDLQRGAARGSDVHAGQRHLRLGDGIQPVEHRASRARSRASTRCRRSAPTTIWAIEYGYRETPPADETAELARIAARSDERYLAFATDEDVLFVALDPDVNTHGPRLRSSGLRHQAPRARARAVAAHGNDEIETGRKLFRSAPQLLARTRRGRSGRRLRDEVHRRPVDAARSRGLRPGAARPDRRRERQRAALQMLAREVFSADSFRFSPAFLRNMAVSPSDIDDAEELGRTPPPVDVADRPADPGAAAHRAERAHEPGDRAAAAQQRRQGRRREAGAAPARALRDAARGRLERAAHRPRHHPVPPQPAARIRGAGRRRAAAPVGDDAGRRAGAAARRGEDAARRDRGGAGKPDVFDRGEGASRRDR